MPDRTLTQLANRTNRMSGSEVRALFAVASRPDVVSLAGGMPSLEDLPAADVQAAVAAALDRHGSAALQYCGGQGLPELRGAIAAFSAEQRVPSEPERIVITAGAQQALDLLGKLFIEPGDEIVVEAPSYVGALSAFSVYEPRFVTVPLDDDGMDVERLAELLARGSRPRFVYTVPNFHNPAGVTMSLDRRERLVEVCRDAGVTIVEDDPYGLLRFEGPALPTLAELDPANVIYLGTLSKVFSPGMRVGWAIAPDAIVEPLVRMKEAADLCSGSFTQLVAERYLAESAWRSGVDALIARYRPRRDAMLDALAEGFPEGTSWTHPRGGFYVWVSLPAWADATELLPEAVRRLVAYVPGTAFYPDGRGRDRLRLSFSHPNEDAIRLGLERLGELLSAPAPQGGGDLQ